MAIQIQIKRRAAGGAAGAPGALTAGELFVNFAGAAAQDTSPALYVGDPTGTIHLLTSQADRLSSMKLIAPSGTPANDQGKVPALDATGKIPAGFLPSSGVTITSKTIPGAGAGPAADGNAQPVAAGQWPWVVAAGEIPIVSHNGNVYMFTGGAGAYGASSGGAPLAPGAFVSLGAATAFAPAAEVRAGTATAKAIDPAGLAAVLPPAVLAAGVSAAQPGHPTGAAAATGVAADANRLVVLDATGKVPTALLPVAGFEFRSADLTAAPAGATVGHQNGRVVVHSGAAGALDAGWTPVSGSAPTTVQPGDMLLSDGTNWHFIESAVDLADYVSKSGANALAETMTMTFAVPAAAGLVTRIDGGDRTKTRIVNVTLDDAIIDGGIL